MSGGLARKLSLAANERLRDRLGASRPPPPTPRWHCSHRRGLPERTPAPCPHPRTADRARRTRRATPRAGADHAHARLVLAAPQQLPTLGQLNTPHHPSSSTTPRTLGSPPYASDNQNDVALIGSQETAGGAPTTSAAPRPSPVPPLTGACSTASTRSAPTSTP
jgi:hypothetical protein